MEAGMLGGKRDCVTSKWKGLPCPVMFCAMPGSRSLATDVDQFSGLIDAEPSWCAVLLAVLRLGRLTMSA